MRRFKSGLVAMAVAVASFSAIPALSAYAKAPSGNWVKDGRGYWYDFSEGTWAKSEYIDGYWIRKNGYWDNGSKYSWHYVENAGYWWGTADGSWYAKKCWQKIDGRWYYFDTRGYMASNQYIEGCWVGANGAYNPGYTRGIWHKATGVDKWWFSDTVGSSGHMWIPKDQWLKIDGYSYYFDERGWMLQSTIAELSVNPDRLGDKDTDYYAFDASGHLSEYTRYNLADKLTAEIALEFDYTDKEAMKEVASTMELFLLTSMGDSTSQKLEINGNMRDISVDQDGNVVVDGTSLMELAENYAKGELTVSGTAETNDLIDAFYGLVLGAGDTYSFVVRSGKLNIRYIGGSGKTIWFAPFDNIYLGCTGMLDSQNGQPLLLVEGKDPGSLGQALADSGMLADGENASVIDSATGKTEACSFIAEP